MAKSARSFATIYGYLSVIITDRGVTPRGLRRAFNTASKQAWEETGNYFHEHYRDERFTPEHAEAAGYLKRKGQLQPPGSKAFRKSYYGRKLNSDRGGGVGKANPLVSSGETRRSVATQYNITATRHGARIAYAGARKLNYRHPASQIRMNQEFRRLLESERVQLGRTYDTALDRLLAASD